VNFSPPGLNVAQLLTYFRGWMITFYLIIKDFWISLISCIPEKMQSPLTASFIFDEVFLFWQQTYRFRFSSCQFQLNTSLTVFGT